MPYCSAIHVKRKRFRQKEHIGALVVEFSCQKVSTRACEYLRSPFWKGSGWMRANINFRECLRNKSNYINNLSNLLLGEEVFNSKKFKIRWRCDKKQQLFWTSGFARNWTNGFEWKAPKLYIYLNNFKKRRPGTLFEPKFLKLYGKRNSALSSELL